MVETGGLENRFALTGNGGSNPSPSATPSQAKRFDLSNPSENAKFVRVLGVLLIFSLLAERSFGLLSKPGPEVSPIREPREIGQFAMLMEKLSR